MSNSTLWMEGVGRQDPCSGENAPSRDSAIPSLKVRASGEQPKAGLDAKRMDSGCASPSRALLF